MGLVMRVSDQVVVLDFGQRDRRRPAGRRSAATSASIEAYLGAPA